MALVRGAWALLACLTAGSATAQVVAPSPQRPDVPRLVDQLTTYAVHRCVGGMVAGATCVNYADPADGGPTGGIIRLSGVPPGAIVERAILYWSVMAPLSPVELGTPAFDGVPILVEPLGEVPRTPCFDQTVMAGFRADVTPLVTGDGAYVLSGMPSDGTVDGLLTEGATLIVIHGATGPEAMDVVIADGIDVTNQDVPIFEQSLSGFGAATRGVPRATLALALGNGQDFPGDVDPLELNGTDLRPSNPQLMSGALCPDAITWHSLYDLSVFDVTGLVPAGSTSATIRIHSLSDCYSIVAAALAVSADSGAPAEPSACDLRPGAVPLRVERSGRTRLLLTWEDLGSDESQAWRGSIGSWYSHAAAACGLASNRVELDLGATDDYFLVAAGGCGRTTSSCGRTSFGVERPSALVASGTACP